MALKYLYAPSGVQAGTAYGVIPNSADADFSSFARSSAGSRVDKNGLINTGLGLGSEEVVNGDFDTDSDWSKGTGWSIANGVATYDGTGGSSFITQNIYISLNTLYEVKITVVSNEGTATNSIEIGNDRVNNAHLDAGTYTFYGTSTSGTNIIIYGKSGEEFVIDNVSVREITEVNTNVPRLDYTGGGCPSLLLEPSSTNLIGYSEDFTQSYWSEGGQIRTYGFSSPEGRYNACLIQKGSAGYITTGGISLIDEQTYTFSFYAKRKTDTTVLMRFQERGGDYTTYAAKSITLTDEWKRYELTGTKGSDTNQARVAIDGIGVGEEFYIYGAQLENQSYATSYIPTFGAASTRSQDVGGSTLDISSEFDSREGTFMFEGSFSDFSSANRVSLNSSVTIFQDRISISTDNTRFLIIYEAGDVGGSFPVNVSDIYSDVKIAVKWSSGSVVCYTNGTESFDRTNIGDFSQNSLNRVTLANANESLPFKGKVKQFRVYDEYLSDAEMVKLTTL